MRARLGLGLVMALGVGLGCPKLEEEPPLMVPQAGLSEGRVAGIGLGDALSAVAEACEAAGERWTEATNAGKCSGPVGGHAASWHGAVEVWACDGRVCGLSFEIAEGVDDDLAFMHLTLGMGRRFGPAMSDDVHPPHCLRDPPSLTACLRAGETELNHTWEVDEDVFQHAHYRVDEDTGRMHLRISFITPEMSANAEREAAEAARVVDRLFD